MLLLATKLSADDAVAAYEADVTELVKKLLAQLDVPNKDPVIPEDADTIEAVTLVEDIDPVTLRTVEEPLIITLEPVI